MERLKQPFTAEELREFIIYKSNKNLDFTAVYTKQDGTTRVQYANFKPHKKYWHEKTQKWRYSKKTRVLSEFQKSQYMIAWDYKKKAPRQINMQTLMYLSFGRKSFIVKPFDEDFDIDMAEYNEPKVSLTQI